MAPTQQEKDNLMNLALNAEKDANSYENKTGAHKVNPSDEAGVDTSVENKFDGAKVMYDQDLSTNRGFNKRIPPEEGGELDSRGRATRGEHFEGVGGPEHKLAKQAANYGGYDTLDPTNTRQAQVGSTSVQDDSVPLAQPGRDAATAGKQAAMHNVVNASQSKLPQKEQFKGSDYYQPEEVPDSIAAEGYVPPESVVQTSKEAEVPEEFGVNTSHKR